MKAVKQEKVLTKIKSSMKHGNEGQLGTKKNDECYTDAQDIYNELSYWAQFNKFQGKNIICPCDWDITDDENIVGITISYKDNGVEVIRNNVYKAVKAVEYDLWSTEEDTVEIKHMELAETEIEDFLRNKLTCNFVRTLTQNARRWGIRSITASGYNPANDRGTKFQDVDYSKYDICITNPPFSLYSEFMKSILGNIDFIVLAPMMNRGAPSIGIALMLKQAYLGYGCHLALNFKNPTTENQYNVKAVSCDWIVSYSEAQDERNAKHFKSGIHYEDYKDEYIIMPNMTMKDTLTHPIRVGTSSYPEDYDGWMFGPISILDNLDQSIYEWYGTGYKGYFNKNLETSIFNHKADNDIMLLCVDGKRAFHGIVFRKKQITE